jgi:hypothetical protein
MGYRLRINCEAACGLYSLRRNALDYSTQHTLSRTPNRQIRNARRTVNEPEKPVVATSIREYVEAKPWRFRRDIIASAAGGVIVEYSAAIDSVIVEWGSDPRAALRALLIAIANDAVAMS